MNAMPARPSKKPRDPAIHQKVEKIKTQIDKIISKMDKDSHYTPTREDIALYAVQINDVIMAHRDQVRPFESFLKAAIIDLTEVPEMHPQMQRISFLTTLKDASHKIQLFLEGC